MSTSPISASPEVGLASKSKAIDWLFDNITNDRRVCDNCFGERDLEREFFRMTGGGNEQLSDYFCTCGSGTGKDPIGDPKTNYPGGGGTVNRQWADGSLPIRDDNGLSEMELVKNLLTYLDINTSYEIVDDTDPQLDILAEKSRNRPTENIKMLKVGIWLNLTPDSRRQLREDAARDGV